MGKAKKDMNILNDIIRKIDSLTYPELLLEIENLGLQNISSYPIISVYPNGEKQKIYRARPTNVKKFNNVRQLSYNPWPKTIDRASTPCTPMFYGTISTNSEDYPMITNFAELNQILRFKSFDYNEQEIAIAEFEVIKDFYVAAIIFCKEFLEKNIQYTKLYKEFKESFKRDFEILEDFSYLFSYTEKDDNHDYRLTSAFTNFVLDRFPKIEAILYPSARLEGAGTNIAIHPVTVNTKLKCKRVVVTKIYMKDIFTINDYISKADIINPDGSFELIDITEPPYPLGKEYCLVKLNEMINGKK